MNSMLDLEQQTNLPMIFSKAILAKGLGGLALLGTSCASAYGGHKIIKNEPTKYDQGLIDYLGDSGDIKFSVKKNETEEITTFPDFTNDVSETKISIKVTATTTSGTGSTEGTLTEKTGGNGSDKGKNKTLRDLNGENDWTWTCIIKFIKDSGANSSDQLDTNQKEKIFNGSTGLLNKLKAENNKNEKIKFIKNCAEARGGFENLKIGLSSSLYDNKIESIKEFKLKKEASNLKFEDQSEFDAWFEAS